MWPAGFGATKHLAQEGYDVTLLDGSPHPGGLAGGYRTAEGRAVEAGIKGFWYQVSLLPHSTWQCHEPQKNTCTELRKAMNLLW